MEVYGNSIVTTYLNVSGTPVTIPANPLRKYMLISNTNLSSYTLDGRFGIGALAAATTAFRIAANARLELSYNGALMVRSAAGTTSVTVTEFY